MIAHQETRKLNGDAPRASRASGFREGSLPKPSSTCLPAVTEAAWLLRGFPHAVRRLLSNTDAGAIEMLVYLVHRETFDTIFTLNRRDFSVYRTAREKPFQPLPA